MPEQLRHLVELQLLENRKVALLKSRNETPQRLHELDQRFARFEGEYLQKKAELEHAQSLHRSLEQETAELESKLVRSKTRMQEVKNNREYQAMDRQVDELKKDISNKEDQMLELMETIEQLQQEVKELEKEVERRRKLLEEEKAKLEGESELVVEKIAKVEAMQAKIQEKLPPQLLERWSFLLRKLAGIAVAPVEKGVCQICHLNLPPQTFIELQRDSDIMFCPHCHRIIYWPGHELYCLVEEELAI